MANVTKLELQQLLAARNAEVEALRLRVAELEGDIVALKARPAEHVSTPRSDERIVQRYQDSAGRTFVKVQIGYGRFVHREVRA